jgi:hypothetical protein
MILAVALHNHIPMAPGMNKWSRDEKGVFRRWQRFRLNLPIRLIISRDNNTRITEGRANDISDGGLLIFAGLELRLGDGVFVEFTPPFSGEAVRARGIVRHRRGYNYGVQFHCENPSEEDQIKKFRNLLSMAAGATHR